MSECERACVYMCLCGGGGGVQGMCVCVLMSDIMTIEKEEEEKTVLMRTLLLKL